MKSSHLQKMAAYLLLCLTLLSTACNTRKPVLQNDLFPAPLRQEETIADHRVPKRGLIARIARFFNNNESPAIVKDEQPHQRRARQQAVQTLSPPPVTKTSSSLAENRYKKRVDETPLDSLTPQVEVEEPPDDPVVPDNPGIPRVPDLLPGLTVERGQEFVEFNEGLSLGPIPGDVVVMNTTTGDSPSDGQSEPSSQTAELPTAPPSVSSPPPPDPPSASSKPRIPSYVLDEFAAAADAASKAAAVDAAAAAANQNQETGSVPGLPGSSSPPPSGPPPTGQNSELAGRDGLEGQIGGATQSPGDKPTNQSANDPGDDPAGGQRPNEEKPGTTDKEVRDMHVSPPRKMDWRPVCWSLGIGAGLALFLYLLGRDTPPYIRFHLPAWLRRRSSQSTNRLWGH